MFQVLINFVVQEFYLFFLGKFLKHDSCVVVNKKQLFWVIKLD